MKNSPILPTRFFNSFYRYEIFRNELVLEKFSSQENIYLDTASNFQVRIHIYFFKGGKIPLLSLNELGGKSQTTIILGDFVKKP